MAAARQAGIAKATAGRVRRELEASGEIPAVRRRGMGKPVTVTGEGSPASR